MTTIALIPMKELSLAKARLAPVLDEAGRRELALAMFRDVLAAAMACSALDGVAVVSSDTDVLAVAAEAGAEGMPEPGGLNEALTSAAEKLRARGATRLLVLAADLPLVDGELLAGEMEEESEADVAVAVSYDLGTNAMWLPPGAIAFQFGPHSGEKHLAAAEAAGLLWVWIESAHLKLDIDTPEDLDRLRDAIGAGEAVGKNTLQALERLGLVSPPVRRA